MCAQLVRQLASFVPEQQQQAARSIATFAAESEQNADAVCAAGAKCLLVKYLLVESLRPDPSELQQHATAAL